MLRKIDSNSVRTGLLLLFITSSIFLLLPLGNGLHNRSDDDGRGVHRLGDEGAETGKFGDWSGPRVMPSDM